jgi:hypothetical protein
MPDISIDRGFAIVKVIISIIIMIIIDKIYVSLPCLNIAFSPVDCVTGFYVIPLTGAHEHNIRITAGAFGSGLGWVSGKALR